MIKNRDNIPEESGIYLFKERDKILYIGKAGNLKKRINQYFQRGGHALTGQLINQADNLEFIVTDNEKDALVLEYNLVQNYRPPFNIRLKDDKSFPYIEISSSHDFPGIFYSRKTHPKYFKVGPITDSRRARNLIDMVTRIFKLRTCTDNTFNKSRACLYYYIDRCSAPCTGKVDGEEYRKTAGEAGQFLKGKKEKVLKRLKQEMNGYAGELEFEKAQKIKEDIASIEQFKLETYISSGHEIDYDVITLYHHEQADCFILLFSILKGRVARRDFFNVTSLQITPGDILKDFMLSYYSSENIPEQIIVGELPSEHEDLALLFTQLRGKKTQIKIPIRGDRKKMLHLALDNLNLYVNRNHFENLGARIKDALHLTRFPADIEGFDISHFSERERVGAVVTFHNGRPLKKNYRNYLIKKAAPGDVFAIKEVLERRFGKKDSFPDLLIIDGGKGQLSAALEVKEKLGIHSDVVAMAKGEERIFCEQGDSLVFPPGSPELFLFQNIRDEVHRRAITHHRKRREKF